MIRPAVLVLTLALYCFSGFRKFVGATPVPLPMPLALMAPDFSSRWSLRNDSAAFNLARDLVPRYTFNASTDLSGHSDLTDVHAYGEASLTLTRRKYTDKIAQLYGFYSTAKDSSSNLSPSSPFLPSPPKLMPAVREICGAIRYHRRE
jgi:hypothetical protein